MDFGYIKQHPYMVGGAVIAGAIVLWLISRSGGSSAAAASGVDPTTASLYAQGMQNQAQLTAQNNQIGGQIQLATIQAQYGLDTAQIQANTAGKQLDYEHDATIQGISAQLHATDVSAWTQVTGIEAQLAGLISNNATSQNIASIQANEQLGITQTISNLQLGIANANAGVAKAQIGATKDIAIANAAGNAGGSLLGLVGSFF